MGALITERQSYVAGRWVEGDESLRRREPRRRDPVRRGVGDARWPSSAAPSPRRGRRSTRDAWAGDDARRTGRASCTRSSTTSKAAAPTLVDTMVAEAGQPRMFAEGMQLHTGAGARSQHRSTSTSRWPTRRATRFPSTSSSPGRVALSIRRHEPVGVVTAITPYNAALIMAFQKIDPRADGRQLGHPAAEPADPDLVARVRRGRGRGRDPRGRAERRRRGGRRRRRAAHDRSRRSTWCRSPARPRSGGRSSPRPRRR